MAKVTRIIWSLFPFLPLRAAAQAPCTHTVEVMISLPMSVERPGCNSRIFRNATADRMAGGTLYVYAPSAAGSKAWKAMAGGKSYVDLAEASMSAGCGPKHKPHMVLPSPDGRHTAVTYTGDQDYAILSNSGYSVVQCPSVEYLRPKVFGGAVHTGAWRTRSTFLAVDMTGCVEGTCGGAIHRHDFTFDGSGAMTGSSYVSSLGHAGVASQRGTAATKPIAMGNNPRGSYAHLYFVTDAKGAGSIMNADNMTWDTHFSAGSFGNCSGGGLWVEPHPDDEKVVLAQYGKQDGASCIFKVDMASKALTLLVQLDDSADAHGLQFCKTTGGQLTVLNTNRQTATLDVVDYATGSFLLRGYDMNANVFDSASHRRLHAQTDKLQPDVAYLHDGFLYMAARGPRPVSAVKAQNYYANAHPGMMALKIDPATCLPAASQSAAFALNTLERSPEITSDVHGLWGVTSGGSKEIWVLDQAATGSVQQYDVYSSCAAYGVSPADIHPDPAPHR
uniref:Alkaline phosphatase n=1 Tax=Alexandrium catenella TaxID=2925 RepID=A0A6T9GR65_ALECA|mmetsp:Transcript_23523/g.63994  ORF Transcript_23523/g.63994 Transcript_23523/m.63994 type:complete len:504 (+) Transcript_23523:33-1544(+)